MKKICTLFTSLALTMSAVLVPVYADENESFQEFLNEEFVEWMESDYLTMHYNVRHPEDYGIEKTTDFAIGDASLSSYEDTIQEAEEALKKLESFDYDALDETSQHDYDVYHTYLEDSIALNSYAMFDFALDVNGVIGNLITNFEEFVFYEKEDFEDYFASLETVPEYLNDCIELTKTQAEKGYFLTDSELDTTLEYINDFCEKTDDNELIVSFNDKIDEYEGLTSSEKEEYKKRNEEIILNEYVPSYETVAEEIEKLRGSRSGDGSLYSMEDGKEYYEALVKYKTGSSKSIQELFNMCDSILFEYIQDYIGMLSVARDDSYESETVDLSTPEEILTYLENHLDEFPEAVDVEYTATYLDPSIAQDTTLAYYLTPAIDDIENNVIKINGEGMKDDINQLYYVLAHEGFPGHLYQTTWYLNTNPSPIRSCITNLGYTEGWGMYASVYAIDNSGLSDNAIRYLKDNLIIGYILNAIADLGVNGLGWTADDVAEYMDGLGLSSSAAAEYVTYVEDNAGLIVPYGVGIAEFLQLKETAQSELGSFFDAKEFNTVLLTYGSRSLDSLEEDVNEWIEEVKNNSEPTETNMPEPSTDPTEPSTNHGMLVYGIGIACGLVPAIVLIIVFNRKNKH